ncbi:MAG: hypothetical protein IJ242_08930 [Clostridia bacterium]|nr:hypothetical protein [Clostridia bacterium]
MKKRHFAIILSGVLMLCTACAAAAIPGIDELTPVPQTLLTDTVTIPLYAGPTVQYPEIGQNAFDPSKPYVCFGQSDCWAMVASGTPDEPGITGWIETAALNMDSMTELSFSNRLSAMVEDPAPLTFSLNEADAPVFCTLPRGTDIQILARYGAQLYIETELDSGPVRGFIPEAAVE